MYGFTLNPPEPEVDTGVSMQLSSSELSYSVLRCMLGLCGKLGGTIAMKDL